MNDQVHGKALRRGIWLSVVDVRRILLAVAVIAIFESVGGMPAPAWYRDIVGRFVSTLGCVWNGEFVSGMPAIVTSGSVHRYSISCTYAGLSAACAVMMWREDVPRRRGATTALLTVAIIQALNFSRLAIAVLLQSHGMQRTYVNEIPDKVLYFGCLLLTVHHALMRHAPSPVSSDFEQPRGVASSDESAADSAAESKL